jgi:predicted secreted acid phosphatase
MEIPGISTGRRILSSQFDGNTGTGDSNKGTGLTQIHDSVSSIGNRIDENRKLADLKKTISAKQDSVNDKLADLNHGVSNKLTSAAASVGGGMPAKLAVKCFNDLDYDPGKASAENWMNTSEEYQCMTQQVYNHAMEKLPGLVEGEESGSWCAMIDMDETLVSNVNFGEMAAGAPGSDGNIADEKSFKQSIRESLSSIPGCTKNSSIALKDGAPLPGAREFTEKVQDEGGKVVIATNRPEWKRENTLENLDNTGIKYDYVIFRDGEYDGDRTKNLRRRDIEEGNLDIPENKNGEVPPLNIKIAIGDSVHDLYNTEENTFNDVKDRLGEDMFLIPNPLYGGWDAVAREDKNR